MLKELLEQRGISVYQAAKEMDVSYSTLNDIVIEKTDIKNISSNLLYRLSKYLDVSMEFLYENTGTLYTTVFLSNDGRNVLIEFDNKHYQYLGPKNLQGFNRINQVRENVIYVDCCFLDENNKIYHEEDYVDLNEILGKDCSVLSNLYMVKIGRRDSSAKEIILNSAMLVSDNIAVLYYCNKEIPDICVEAVCLARPSLRAIIRIKDLAVVSSNMSETILKRAVTAVSRNVEDLTEKIVEVQKYA